MGIIGSEAGMRSSTDILARLIAFPTVSSASNLPLIEWIQQFLADRKIESRLSFDATGTKANLFATVGPRAPGGLLVSGHTDVVPVDKQDWHSDPFRADFRDGRIYGRGACDMKGFLASTLWTVANVDVARLRKPVHLAFTYDEEVGCKGVRTLIDAMSGYQVAPGMCVIGEPTSMRVVRSHKGSRNYRCSVKGRAAHASMTHEGLNAIHYAAAMVGKIHDYAEALEGMTFPESGYDRAYDMLQTSLITGGLARNIVPSQCEFTFGYRYLPQSDPDRIFREIEDFGMHSVLPRMRARCEESDLKFEKLSDNPALRDDQNQEVATIVAARKGVQGVGPHVGFMTEGGLYQQAGIPTVICGPGSIEQAHKPDEYVDVSQLSLCSTFLEDLFTHCAS